MVNDGTQHYDHDRDGTHGQMDGCTVSELKRISYASHLMISEIIVVSFFDSPSSEIQTMRRMRPYHTSTEFYR